ncbi:hypothetical protein ABZP36_023889 [Zizania latifolia]
MLALDIAYTIYMKFEDLASALQIALLLDNKKWKAILESSQQQKQTRLDSASVEQNRPPSRRSASSLLTQPEPSGLHRRIASSLAVAETKRKGLTSQPASRRAVPSDRIESGTPISDSTPRCFQHSPSPPDRSALPLVRLYPNDRLDSSWPRSDTSHGRAGHGGSGGHGYDSGHEASGGAKFEFYREERQAAPVVGLFFRQVLFIIALWLSFRRKKKTVKGFDSTSQMEIPIVSKDINVDRVDAQSLHDSGAPIMPVQDKYSQTKDVSHLAESRSVDVDAFSQCSSVYNIEKAGSSYSEDYSSSGPARKGSSPYGYASASPLVGLPELSHLGWGHWFTLRDLEYATDRFAKSNVLGEGGYGIVYRGRLMNGTEVAVKKILNNVGQAEKEFRVEVEAIAHRSCSA